MEHHSVMNLMLMSYRLKKDLQDCNDQKEVSYIHMKKKHTQEIAELNETNATQAQKIQK